MDLKFRVYLVVNYIFIKQVTVDHLKKIRYALVNNILGVNKKTCNGGIIGELAIYPIYLDIIRNLVKYAQLRLQNINGNSLLKSAFRCNINNFVMLKVLTRLKRGTL